MPNDLVAVPRSLLMSLSAYLSGGYYEPRTEEEGRLAGEILVEVSNLPPEQPAILAQLQEARAARDALCAELLTPEVFVRVKQWLQESPRRPANLAFTAGIERQIAYLLESAGIAPAQTQQG